MPRGWLTLAALVSCSIQLSSAAPQQFASRVEAVRVDVLATDGRHAITNLDAGDFELRDNGVLQDIRLVEAQQLPLGIVCALDVSDSVAGPTLTDLSSAATTLLDNLHADDTVALLSFAARVRLLAPFTHDTAPVRAAISALKPGGRTALRNAAFAAFALRAQTSNRPLILLFSDGQDTVSWLGREDVRSAAARTDVVFYAVLSESSGGEAHVPFLREIAAATGGRVLIASASTSIQSTFAAILEEFRTRYVLTYVPRERVAGWHTLSVRLTRPRGRVTARKGYFVE